MNDAAMNQLGLSLRDIRKQRDLTLAQASERSGLPVSTLSKIENNRMSLSYDKLLRICQALEIDIAQLFAGDSVISAPTGAVPSGRRSQLGDSSVRNNAMPKLTGTAISKAMKEVASVP